MFLNEEKIRKIRIIFGIKRWLWKPEFGLLWPSLLKWTEGLELLRAIFINLWPCLESENYSCDQWYILEIIVVIVFMQNVS